MMNALLKKLNFKDAHQVVLINVPEDLSVLVEAFAEKTAVRTAMTANAIEFALCFVTTQQEIQTLAEKMRGKLVNDAIIWFAYPKGTSKQYTCNFNRDTGWEALGSLGLETVRQVAIDSDWTALRFRHVSFVKSMTRSEKIAISPEGKKRTSKKSD